MLSRLSRQALRKTPQASCSAAKPLVSHRGFVQPSGAERANVVDIPSLYQEDGHFSPQSGIPHSQSMKSLMLMQSP
jgi:cysteine desulfurase